MTVKEILTPMINQELQKYQYNGNKVKLKSVTKYRLLYTLFCGLGAILFWPIALIVYICLMSGTDNVNIILKLAKKYPDTPVDQIIAQEVIR